MGPRHGAQLRCAGTLLYPRGSVRVLPGLVGALDAVLMQSMEESLIRMFSLLIIHHLTHWKRISNSVTSYYNLLAVITTSLSVALDSSGCENLHKLDWQMFSTGWVCTLFFFFLVTQDMVSYAKSAIDNRLMNTVVPITAFYFGPLLFEC